MNTEAAAPGSRSATTYRSLRRRHRQRTQVPEQPAGPVAPATPPDHGRSGRARNGRPDIGAGGGGLSRGADRIDPGCGRYMGRVIASPGQLHQPDVAFDHDHFGDGGDALEAQAGRDLALVDLALGSEAGLLGMLDQGQERRW